MSVIEFAPIMDTAVNRTEELARRVRIHALRMCKLGRSSHIGSVLSCADILAVLYGRILRVDPRQPRWADRDRFILSKGHACAGLYAVLAERGFFPIDRLDTHYQNGSLLSGHASHLVPGVEVSTGSLGHGLSLAAGMAYGAALDGRSHRVLAMLSDGECDEGSVWEAAMFAAHHRLKSLTVVVDYNRLQGIAPVPGVIRLEPFAERWRSFGWTVRETNGHHHALLHAALSPDSDAPAGPTCVIAHTIKGKGVSFMEDAVLWHYRIPAGTEYEAARAELQTAR
jgi:transketolase